MSNPRAPTATYRLQLNRDFTVADAAAILPYLRTLGITHVYASPFLKARAGSPHGYDIVDHNVLNPEIGDAAAFEAFFAALKTHGLGQFLDIVPNHMGVGGDDNAWWLDVLEHGEASSYAGYFDIDWRPVNAALRNKVLAPVLGDHYGAVLETGQLELGFDPGAGAINLRYFAHLFPLDPRTYPRILSLALARLSQGPDNGDGVTAALQALIEDCRRLPRRTERSSARRRQRRHGAAACKTRLAELARSYPAVFEAVQWSIGQVNGTPGEPASFDRLHRLLEDQAYRLAYWVVAADDINYRRFFDINDLAGIRMENPEVFRATHRLIRRLVAEGHVQGLRIDHPDGLADPRGYYDDLARLIDEAAAVPAGAPGPSCPVLVEKILASYERLPTDWAVAGTTGYEAAYLLNGLLIQPRSEKALSRLYARFTGRVQDFDELLYQCKKLITRRTLASELTVLANLATAIAQSDRRTRDFTYHGLRDAIAELAVCFPIYRTYLTPEQASAEDRRYVDWALAQAKKHSPAAAVQILDFVADLLTLEHVDRHRPAVRHQATQFTLRFQQYSAPVMAKGLEDTAMYRYHRLISLNDVGFDPRTYGVTAKAFHHANQQRQELWPCTMVSTSTHDSKRGEDVRARVDVLSEIPDEWRQRLRRWRRINTAKKRQLDDLRAPTRNDEYLIYQTLLGVWPLGPVAGDALTRLQERIEAYLLKAVREAKSHSAWINPNDDYEEAIIHFVRGLMSDADRNPFLADFLPFQRRVARFGLLNALSQTLLKLTVPGVPDVYQGNETWAFNLVDPDNRRPVDYRRLAEQLGVLARSDHDDTGLVRALLDGIDDGRLKLYLTWRTLTLRRERPDLFRHGDYRGLEVAGPRHEHVVAFARRLGEQEVVVAAARWFALLAGVGDAPPTGSPLWDGVRLILPEEAGGGSYRDVLTGRLHTVQTDGNGSWLMAAALFGELPLALLSRV